MPLSRKCSGLRNNPKTRSRYSGRSQSPRALDHRHHRDLHKQSHGSSTFRAASMISFWIYRPTSSMTILMGVIAGRETHTSLQSIELSGLEVITGLDSLIEVGSLPVAGRLPQYAPPNVSRAVKSWICRSKDQMPQYGGQCSKNAPSEYCCQQHPRIPLTTFIAVRRGSHDVTALTNLVILTVEAVLIFRHAAVD
ncbi:hypothetical protein B0H21DRAFT_373607 [Amylocystis lapponica]|nr:hypothetical protein B0H21DRAFT_373607 [Amylocystis lapponica]